MLFFLFFGLICLWVALAGLLAPAGGQPGAPGAQQGQNRAKSTPKIKKLKTVAENNKKNAKQYSKK